MSERPLWRFPNAGIDLTRPENHPERFVRCYCALCKELKGCWFDREIDRCVLNGPFSSYVAVELRGDV